MLFRSGRLDTFTAGLNTIAVLQRQIDATDTEIDKLLYDLSLPAEDLVIEQGEC